MVPGSERQAMGYVPALDGLRTIAILFVMATHLSRDWAPGGMVGVDIFFVLSGFLITDILLRPGISLKAFYIRRAQRLLPALVCTVVLAYFLWPYTHPDASFWPSAIKALLYVTNFSHMRGVMTGCLSHTWSLANEEQFYLVWPILLFNVPRLKTQWKSIALLALSIAIARIVLLHQRPLVALLASYFSPLSRADELLTGAILAVGGSSLFRLRRMAVPAMVGGGLFVFCYTNNWTAYASFGIPIVCVGVAAVISDCVAPQRSVLQRVLSLPAMVWLGRRSYGIYLYHMPIFFALGPLTIRYGLLNSGMILATITVLVAQLSYVIVERPILALSLTNDGRVGVRAPKTQGNARGSLGHRRIKRVVPSAMPDFVSSASVPTGPPGSMSPKSTRAP
jgi:peptidoglycan/LPS O-acetylase OafA/YrhL